MTKKISIQADYRPRTQYEKDNNVPAILQLPSISSIAIYGKQLRGCYLSQLHDEKCIVEHNIRPIGHVGYRKLKRWKEEDNANITNSREN